MKKVLNILIFISLFSGLAGCCPNGCFVLTGPAFEALANPIPMREQWSKMDKSDAERRLDWESCGGYQDGNFSPTQKTIDDERQLWETNESPADGRLLRKLQRCMLRKGYHYIGKCYDNEISRTLPACGAP